MWPDSSPTCYRRERMRHNPGLSCIALPNPLCLHHLEVSTKLNWKCRENYYVALTESTIGLYLNPPRDIQSHPIPLIAPQSYIHQTVCTKNFIRPPLPPPPPPHLLPEHPWPPPLPGLEFRIAERAWLGLTMIFCLIIFMPMYIFSFFIEF